MDQGPNQGDSRNTSVNHSIYDYTNPFQPSQQQAQQHAFGHVDTMEQRYNNVPFNPLLLQQPQQAQRTPLNNVPHMQLPFQPQVYNPPFGVNNMTWSSHATAPHCLQSTPAVRMTPSVTVIATPTFPTLQSSQSRTLDTTVTTLYDQYGSSSQQRPFYGVWDYPTYGATLPPLQSLQQLQQQLQQYQQQQHAIHQTMKQHYSNSPLPLQQTQMTTLHNISNIQLPFQPPIYNSPCNNMTWTSSIAASHSLQSSLIVTMTPNTANIITSSFPSLLSLQSRTLDTTVTIFHDQYGSPSQHRPLHDMCDYPMYGATLPPLLPLSLQNRFQQSQQQKQRVIHQTMEQQYSSFSFNSSFQPLQQTQMIPLDSVPHMQLPVQQQNYNSSFNNMTWTSSVAASHLLQSSSVVRMVPNMTVIITSSLQSSQPRTLDTTVTTLNDQYGLSSQQRPPHDMCDHPTCGAISSPPPQQVTTMAQAKTVYKNYVEKLIKCLPMDDAHFTAQLLRHNLLPSNTNNKIKALHTQADKASYFLNYVVKPALDIDHFSSFDNLLSVMKHCDFEYVKELADEIESEINRRSNIKTAVSELDTLIISVIDMVIKNLRSVYQNTRFNSSGEQWPPNQPKLIVSVALIHYKGSRTKQELFEMASIHKEGAPAIDTFTLSTNEGSSAKKPRLDYSRVTKNIADIFAADPIDLTETGTSSTKAPKRILIEGAPGIGKTVLAKEIAYQWAIDKILTGIKIIFLLYLRDPRLQLITTTKQLVEYIIMGCLNDEQITTFNKYLVDTQGRQLCIVMDGFDEYPNTLQKNSFIVDIINGKVLPEAIVVITSRPTSTVSLHDQVERRIDILGLPKEERENYISQKFIDKPEQKEKLDRYLKKKPIINGLCFVPLHLAVLLYLFQQGCLPETLTEMNESFILHTIYRHLKKNKQTPSDPVVKLSMVPKPVLDIVNKLAQLAFEGLQETKIVFTFDEIKGKCPGIDHTVGAINGFGLLQAIEHYTFRGAGVTTSFNFLHYTMQEYLAALHVSNLPNERQSSLMEKTFWDGHYNFMWMMFVGIVGIKSDAFVQFISKGRVYRRKSGIKMTENILNDKRKRLHVFQCYMEANSSSAEAPEVISDMFKDNIIFINGEKLLPHHISSLMTFVSNSTMQWKGLVLKHCKITDVGMNVLKQFILEKVSTLECINLSHNVSSPWGLYCAYIRQHELTSLTLGGDNGMKEYVNEITESLQNNANLQSLKLEDMTKEGIKLIFDVIVINKALQKLDWSNNMLADNGAAYISDGLKKNNTLLELSISHNNITNQGTEYITEAIKVNVTLKKLDLSYNILEDDGATVLSNSLNLCNFLVELDISHNAITNLGIIEIAKAIQVNSTLQNIDISKNYISTEGLLYFMEAVKNNCTIQVVNIAYNNVTWSGFTKIKECIDNLRYSLQITASWNELTRKYKNKYLLTKIFTTCAPDDIKEDVWSWPSKDRDKLLIICFSEALKEDSRIIKLDLVGKVNNEEVKIIKEAFKVNKTLQELDIFYNNISDDGAAAISDALKSNNSLQMLDMSNNNITSEGAKLIAEAIAVNKTLQKLEIIKNNISDDGAAAISDVLKSNNLLQMLKMSDNKITSEGAKFIAEAIKVNKALKELNINENTISDNGAAAISDALKSNNSLQMLKMSDNNITSKGAKFIAEAIKVNKALQKLDINTNNISDDGLAAISDALKSNNSLQILDMSHNKITSEGAKLIAEAIKVNTTLHTLDLRQSNINDRVSFNRSVLTAVYHNNTLMKLILPWVYGDDARLVRIEVENINKERTRQALTSKTLSPSL